MKGRCTLRMVSIPLYDQMVWKRFLLLLILIFNYCCFSTIICRTRFKMGEKTKIVNTDGADVIDRELELSRAVCAVMNGCFSILLML